jgi:hypothetical protein
MAVNEKVVYATQHTCHAGVVYRPGEQMTGRAPEHAVRGAVEQGLTTESHAEAQRARGMEEQRRRDVAQQIASRSEKRDSEKRVDRRG